MPYRRISFEAGAVYHVYNRGVARQAIFFHSGDYELFRQRICEHIFPVASMIAICQMPNHYHMVLRINDVQFSEAMKRFTLSFVKAVNKSQSRVGPLFQGRFRAIRVHDDRYLATLVDYVHHNPVKGGIAHSLDEWDHSSYHAYAGRGIAVPGLLLSQCIHDPAFEWPSLTKADLFRQASPSSKKTGKNTT